MKIVETLEQFKKLKIGTQLYLPQETNISNYYYAGENPLSKGSIILIHGGNVQKMHGEYIGRGKGSCQYYVNYNDACEVLLLQAQRNVQTIKEIFINPKIKS